MQSKFLLTATEASTEEDPFPVNACCAPDHLLELLLRPWHSSHDEDLSATYMLDDVGSRLFDPLAFGIMCSG